jgi:hypothetical protein
MLRAKLLLSVWLLLICSAISLSAQHAALAAANAVVPPVVKFSGVLTDTNNKPLAGTVGVTFSLYQESEGGAPLWVETQNVTPDKTGHYSVMLGSASAQGLPGSAFASGEARWLGVQAQGQTEQPRTLLMSVPYALKALDAETVGGLPPSAFVQATAAGSSTASGTNPSGAAISGSGTANNITKWLSATKLGNSNIFDGASGKVGIATTSPGATLDVNGSAIVRDNATVSGNLTATGVVTGSSYQIGSNLFAFGSFSNFNAFLGFGGNTATTGTGNTANGVAALQTNTTGSNNTANGAYALDGNSGSNNTVIGFQAIYGSGTGSFNTALGALSGLTNDSSDMTGTNNTFIGIGTAISTGTVSNATAIGANADVAESNALVLGSINGVNGATASTNVGIGTTAPLAALDVAGGGGVRTFIGNPSCGSFAGVGFGASGFVDCQNYSMVGDGTNTFIAAPTGQILFRVDKNTYTAMFIGSSGAVGIGTLSPDSSLSVNGNADKTGGGSWGTFSDGRLKNLNGSFNTGLSQVLKIHPIRYRYKADNAMGLHDSEEHVGVVAQDVQKVIPEAVTENSKGYLMVNNDPIIWSMLNAIKEQQGLIHKQQVQVQLQQAKIDRLSRQVRAVQTALKASQRADAGVQTASAMVPTIHH